MIDRWALTENDSCFTILQKWWRHPRMLHDSHSPNVAPVSSSDSLFHCSPAHKLTGLVCDRLTAGPRQKCCWLCLVEFKPTMWAWSQVKHLIFIGGSFRLCRCPVLTTLSVCLLSGTSRPPVPLRVLVCTRGWTGCPMSWQNVRPPNRKQLTDYITWIHRVQTDEEEEERFKGLFLFFFKL